MINPFLNLTCEPAFEALGDDYSDPVLAAEFPQHTLRFRNDKVLPTLGLDPAMVSDADFIQAFGKFEGRVPLLAMRYHGYQFGQYNPALGDGRGFLYGQVRGMDGELYDFGTKGSGPTPYSRGGDGRLTLKGGVREVLAAEMLAIFGVSTSRCLSLIETGEGLWRGDEPSPTRSSVMVRMQRSHIRFGTFERLHYLKRPDLIRPLLDHTLSTYYPHLTVDSDGYSRFYAELVQRVAELAAQWMSAGFCHAVLNTDNMSITGESFDYGPYAFIERYDPQFTAAYFDYAGRYCYANQPGICYENLARLQVPLSAVIDEAEMAAGLSQFEAHYIAAYRQRMLHRLGFDELELGQAEELVALTIQFLESTQIGYHDFFIALRQQFSASWRSEPSEIFTESIDPQSFASKSIDAQSVDPKVDPKAIALESSFKVWKEAYHRLLNSRPEAEMEAVKTRLSHYNPSVVIMRPEIEAIWEPITTENNWEPFYDLLKGIWGSVK